MFAFSHWIPLILGVLIGDAIVRFVELARLARRIERLERRILRLEMRGEDA